MRDFLRFAEMSKFTITDNERVLLETQADRLDAGFSILDEIETDNVLPLVTMLTNVQNVLRKDVTIKNIPRETLLATAPESQDGYFVVPKTVE